MIHFSICGRITGNVPESPDLIIANCSSVLCMAVKEIESMRKKSG